jgi:hypothetical protein
VTREQLKGRKDLFGLTISGLSKVHHEGEGMAEQRSSHHGGQEAKKRKYRTIYSSQ